MYAAYLAHGRALQSRVFVLLLFTSASVVRVTFDGGCASMLRSAFIRIFVSFVGRVHQVGRSAYSAKIKKSFARLQN